MTLTLKSEIRLIASFIDGDFLRFAAMIKDKHFNDFATGLKTVVFIFILIGRVVNDFLAFLFCLQIGWIICKSLWWGLSGA